MQTRPIDWHIVGHHLPGLLGLVLAVGAAVWLTRRFVPALRQSAIARLLFILLVYLAVAGQCLTTIMINAGFAADDPDFGLELLLNGTGRRPYVYRRLSADAIRAMSNLGARLVSQQNQRKMEHQSHLRRFAFHGDTLRQYRTPDDTAVVDASPPEVWNRQKALDFHAAYAFVFLCLFATLWLARAWTRQLFPDAPLFADIAPAIALILRLYTQPYMFYDISETLLVVASAMCLTQRRIWVHLIVFTLAVFNKESNLLLAPIAVIALAGAIPRRRLAAAGVAHVVIGVGILAWLYSVYGHNPGGPVQNHIVDNIEFWTNPASYFRLHDVFAPLIRTPAGVNPLLAIPTAALLIAGWRPAPSIIRRMLVTSLGLTIPLCLVFGYGDETRDLGLAAAAIYATACFGARRLYAGVGDAAGAERAAKRGP